MSKTFLQTHTHEQLEISISPLHVFGLLDESWRTWTKPTKSRVADRTNGLHGTIRGMMHFH